MTVISEWRRRQAALLAALLAAAGCAWASPAPATPVLPAKPPVAPRDEKPKQIAPLPNALRRRTLAFRLRHDRRLDGRNIRVSAHGARVTLSGSIPNYHQRRIARQIAQSMQGITTVDDRMRVRSQPPPAVQTAQAVQSRLKNDKATSGQKIQVQARRDVVSLRGTVTDLYTKRKAIHLARGVPFVSVVEDHLIISPGLSGHALAEQVRQALARSPLAVQRPLRVVATGSHVSVRGGAYTAAARLRAGVIASQVPGVTGLNNMVVVLPQAVRRR